jgi:GTP-dependent phosphoenolpyruvate carboxykinase
LDAVLSIDHDQWRAEAADQQAFLSKFGQDIPCELTEQNKQLVHRLG